mgnify:FL=1
MSTTQIISKRLHVTTAIDFVYDVTSNSAYYVFAAKHTPYDSGDSSVPTPNDAVVNNYINIYNDMLFGKKVSSADVEQMIPRYDWTAGTTYAMYDDTDPLLYSKQFFVVVDAGAQFQVYKCLYNGGNVASTVEPSGTDNDAYESVLDGYIRKYMYSASSATIAKFATNQYIPLTPNTSITAAASVGSIEVIAVEDGGVGYNNYLTGSFELATDLRLNSGYGYALGSTASSTPNFYNNCIILMTSGPAINEYRVITNYNIVDGKKIATLNEPFVGLVGVTDTFEVYPFVNIYDTGGIMQVNCIARAIVSPASGNSVSKIEVIEPGSGYRSAIAVISPAGAVGVSANASLRPIMSPPNGHGANSYYELGSNYAGIAVKFIENEGVAPELRTENQFRQVGILRNPLFANVEISYSAGNTVGAFLADEPILQYKEVILTGTVNTYSTTTITGNATYFEDNLAVGDTLLITDGVSNVFGNVATIASNTSLTLDVESSFTSDECSISLANAVLYGTVSANSVGTIYVANVNVSNVSSSLKFVGEESFCTTIADTIKICRGGSTPDVRNTNNFVTFSQLTKLAGTLDSGTFVADEYVKQDSVVSYADPSARLYAAIEDGGTDYLYVTNVQNVWQAGEVATGNTSDAQFTVTNKYEGELVPGSGEVMYIENVAPISRSDSQTETIKLILEF